MCRRKPYHCGVTAQFEKLEILSCFFFTWKRNQARVLKQKSRAWLACSQQRALCGAGTEAGPEARSLHRPSRNGPRIESGSLTFQWGAHFSMNSTGVTGHPSRRSPNSSDTHKHTSCKLKPNTEALGEREPCCESKGKMPNLGQTPKGKA